VRLLLNAPIFIVLLSIHLFCESVAWAEADAIHPGTHAYLVWSILSAPLFYVLPGRAISEYFWFVATLNSVLWAALIAGIMSRLVSMAASKSASAI
jgi:hypothetical protein